MLLKNIITKAFFSGYYFTIAIKKANPDDKKWEGDFIPSVTLPANRNEWCADPMIVEDSGRAYLFYEAVSGDLGRIEVREVLSDCSLSSPAVLFHGDGHYSYPYVFCSDGIWYMIPETSDRNEVMLFRSVDFPYKWEKQATILRGRFVDTTVFSYKSDRYMITFETDLESERVVPKAFRLLLTEESFLLTPLEWEEFDPLCVRGAGPAFIEGDTLIRPVQISTEQRYGDAVAFHEIRIEGDRYSESKRSILSPDRIRYREAFMDGLHTYSVSDHFAAIDIRCRELDIWKPIRKMKNRLACSKIRG